MITFCYLLLLFTPDDKVSTKKMPFQQRATKNTKTSHRPITMLWHPYFSILDMYVHHGINSASKSKIALHTTTTLVFIMNTPIHIHVHCHCADADRVENLSKSSVQYITQPELIFSLKSKYILHFTKHAIVMSTM